MTRPKDDTSAAIDAWLWDEAARAVKVWFDGRENIGRAYLFYAPSGPSWYGGLHLAREDAPREPGLELGWNEAIPVNTRSQAVAFVHEKARHLPLLKTS